MSAAKPFTPETLADRWGVSAKHVRELCARGTLSCFRVGKLYRIPASVVETHERGSGCTGSSYTGERGPLSGEKADPQNGEASGPMTRAQPNGHLRILRGPGNRPIVTR